jgi:hypothetical protein
MNAEKKPKRDPDERLSLPIDTDDALRALMQIDAAQLDKPDHPTPND